MQRKLNTDDFGTDVNSSRTTRRGSWQKETRETKTKEAANSPAVRARKAEHKQVVARVAAASLVDNGAAAAVVAVATGNG